MPFRYLRDPLFLFCVVLYFVNRLWLKPAFFHPFLHNYLNDFICIPFWVPIMLWLMKRCGARRHDESPQWHEVVIPVLVWSVVFEVVLPELRQFEGRAISDVYDVVAYGGGALISSLWWGWYYRPNPVGRSLVPWRLLRPRRDKARLYGTARR